MNFLRQHESADINKKTDAEIEGTIREVVRRDSAALRRPNGDSEVAANNLSGLLRRVSGHSTRELDNLINELQTLRERLHADGSRVEREIVEYADLSQSVVQLTRIIADGVANLNKVPDAPNIGE